MTDYEFAAYVDNYHYRQRDSWEQTRLLAMCLVQPYVKHPVRACDVVRFPWEEEKKPRTPSDEELKEVVNFFKK